MRFRDLFPALAETIAPVAPAKPAKPVRPAAPPEPAQPAAPVTPPAAPETWATRFAATQRRETKKAKLRTKVADMQAKTSADASAAAAKRARTNDKLTAAKRDLTAATKPI